MLGRLHRWVGLAIAGFLVMSGLTGTVISWDHDIDEWLNEDLYLNQSQGPMRSPLALASAVEAADPRARVVYLTIQALEGHNSVFFVVPKTDPSTGRPYVLGYNQAFVDPVTAEVKGRRDNRDVSLSTRTLMPFLRRLHYTLHIPPFGGIDRWGYWLMGGVALVWLLDRFVGFYLTLPRRSRLAAQAPAGPPAPASAARFWQRWKPAWKIRLGAGGQRLNFDIHRAFGLWTWALVFVIAFTSFSINLKDEIFHPIMSVFSQTTPGINSLRPPQPVGTVIPARIGFAEVIERARAEANARGWEQSMGGLFYNVRTGVYNASFFDREDEHGADGMGLSNLFIDGSDGRVLSQYRPWEGTAADIFIQLQLPLHSGRILGLPGQILMSVMGLVVAALSVTGVVIWARRARARRHATATSAVRPPVRRSGTMTVSADR